MYAHFRATAPACPMHLVATQASTRISSRSNIQVMGTHKCHFTSEQMSIRESTCDCVVGLWGLGFRLSINVNSIFAPVS